MDSSNPAYADNARRCDREAEIYQVAALLGSRISCR